MTNPSSWPAALQPFRLARALALATALPFALATPAHAAVVISQVYGGGGNTSAVFANDFVELFNAGADPVSINNWTVQYAAATGTGNFVASSPVLTGTLQPGQYYLVKMASGGANGAMLPAEDKAGNRDLSGTGGKVILANVSSSLACNGSSTACTPAQLAQIVDLVGWNTANFFETAAAGATTNATALLRKNSGCTDTGSNAADFAVGTPAPRNSITTAAPCNGTGPIDPPPPPPPPPTAKDAKIYEIQGSGVASAMAGQIVNTTGVVTKLLNNGFFIQDPTGDGNPATSDGILVFTSTAPPAAAVVGQLVQVTGTVVEFSTGSSTLTEIGTVTEVKSLGSAQAITPTLVTLPLAVGDTLERFEGMLVRIDGALTVQQNNFQARYGQLTVGAGGRHETPTNRYRAGSPEAIALADLQARSRLLLDDGSSLQNTNPTAYQFANGVPRAGDLVNNLVGVLDYGPATTTASGPGLYRLQPTEAPGFAIANPRMALPPSAGGNVVLGSMNVLNFFTTFTDGATVNGETGKGCTLGSSTSASNCRGANSLAEFQRQRAKIVLALAGMNADAVGLMEIQNNGTVAAQNLVDALNARVGAGTYAVVPTPAQGTGTDAIRVAMIYKPAKLTPVGASVSDPDSINNRAPLAQTFAAANGEKFTLIVNHLKSKSSCPTGNDPGNADSGDGQGCWNAQRVLQAQRLRTFVAQVQSSSGSNDVLLIGDFNAYAQEDPIFDLTSSGYIDQSGRFETFGYSYVFDGTAGRLDHAISTATLSPKVVGTVHWHIDADEGLAQDYNFEFKQPACATCAPDPFDDTVPFRASDHDPVLVGLSLFKTIIGTSGNDRINGTPGDDVIIGGAGADTITGGGGVNVYVYTSSRDVGDTITDFVPGKDFIDMRTLLQSVGYAGTDPVADGTIRFTALNGGTRLLFYGRPFLTLLGVAPTDIDGTRDLMVR